MGPNCLLGLNRNTMFPFRDKMNIWTMGSAILEVVPCLENDRFLEESIIIRKQEKDL